MTRRWPGPSAAWPRSPTARTPGCEYLVAAYARHGRHEDALTLRVAQIEDVPTLDSYRALNDDAVRMGRWAELREQALAQLLAGVEGDSAAARRSPWATRDRSLLVEIFLWENDLTAAWEHAQAGGCSTALWRRLALARGRDHPDDALAVYRLLVDRAVAQTNDGGYRHAVALLDELGGLLAGCGREPDHAELLADVRAVHRRKRNLIKLLDRRWPASTPSASPRMTASRSGAGARKPHRHASSLKP